ncbi:transferase [Lithospermum erythrorhizon]|uniref:Transferase n=1 Tax=Lithospermum erythrorhizon TaxID=34254 RepID=A0AAV3RI83_LITER
MLNTKLVLSLVLLLCFPLIFLLAQRILPSKLDKILLPDELDDLALFRKATLASIERKEAEDHYHSQYGSILSFLSKDSTPPPKIAFLFLTNSNIHFAPLWEKFFQNKSTLYNIYIHADPTVKIKNPGGVFKGRFIAAKGTERGSPTLIAATRRLLAAALLDDPLNMFFALISQHCIPVHSFDYMYHSLFYKPISGSTRFRPANSNRFPYKSFIEILSGEPGMHERYLSRGENVMLPEVPFDQFRVGSQFFVLTREHALLVINDRRLWRKFRLPCLDKYACYAEEHYFPTLLSMEDPKWCTQYTLTRVDWRNSSDGHPHTYRPPEVSPELIRNLRKSNTSSSYFFARKFSPDCLKPLLHIAQSAIFRE